MKLLSIILISIGGLFAFFSAGMSLLCVEKSEYDKFAKALYRWVFIIGIILASVGVLLLQSNI